MSTSKAIKSIIFTAVAQEHHNATKIKNVLKWLKTGHEVRIRIEGKSDRQKAMESIFKDLKSSARSGAKVIQKVTKPNSIKFYLKPTQDAATIFVDEDQDGNGLPDVDKMTEGQDILSDDFAEELDKSIAEESKRSKRK